MNHTTSLFRASWLAAALLGLGTAAQAAPTFVTGADPVLAVPGIPVDSQAAAAKNSLLSRLTNVTTDGLESFNTGVQGPLSLFSGATRTATLSQGACGPGVNFGCGVTDNTTNDAGGEFLGRFNTSPDVDGQPASRQWWETPSGFEIHFAAGQTVSAFGFYGTDFGDFLGTFTLDLLQGSNVAVSKTVSFADILQVQGTTPGPATGNGSLLFVGFWDDSARYSGFRFNVGQCLDAFGNPCSGGIDVLGFDDFFYADLRTNDVPEPGSLALVGLSLLGLAASRRRRG